MKSRRSLLAITAAALLAGAAPSAQKRPIAHEDVWLMKRVGAPVPSPDGRWALFPVSEPAYDEKDQASDLWIAPSDGSAAPRRVTFTKGGEGGAAWSADSRRIAFSAKREGDDAAQIYVLDLEAGGEAARATSLSTGARAPQFSPDGKSLLFVSSVYPGARDDEANKKIAAERKARKHRARVYDGFPIRNWDRWLEDTQSHVFVQSLDPGARPVDLLAGTHLAAEPGFAGRTSSGGDELDAIWAPDGRSVVFVATANRNAAAYAEVHTCLWAVPASGGEPRRLTSEPGNCSRPVFSPDGSSLLLSFTPDSDRIYSLDRVASIPWPGGGPLRILTPKFDRSVGSFALTPDGRTLYMLAEEAGHEKLFSAPAAGGEARPVFEMTLGAYANLAIPARAAAPLLLANWDCALSPPEVVRVDPAAGRHAPLSGFNTARAAEIDWQPLRHFWFTSKRGKRIHNMIALPPAFDEKRKYPLFVVIHGGPHSMWRDQFVIRWNYHLLARPGYVLLLTDYTGSTGYGEKFAQEIQGDPLAGPGDELNEAADEAIRLFPFIDASRQAAGGASYGGHLANWLQGTTTRYKCLISHAGLVNLESQWGTSDTIYSREVTNGGPVWEQGKIWREQNPIRRAASFRTPILVTVGEQDFRVPLNNSIENWSVLQRLRVPSRLIVFPDENHWIMKGEDSRFFYREVQDWLAKYLGP